MTKHDEIRQILFDTGFKFNDGRTALGMTDEEVEVWLVNFLARMTELGRQMSITFGRLAVTINQSLKPLYNLNELLAESEENEKSA